MPRTTALDVFYGTERMGTVHDSAPLAFEYAPAWLGREDAFSLSVIPLEAGRIESPHVQAFFENLLPEGELRTYLSEQRKASTLFSLLLEVAGDTAGAGHRLRAQVREGERPRRCPVRADHPPLQLARGPARGFAGPRSTT